MESLSDRKKALLTAIIEEYIHTAHPIASQLLVEKLGLDLSSATIRNEMKELEEQGYITHPHTSAGRIPTEIGYRFYVQNFVHPTAELPITQQQALDQLAARVGVEQDMRVKTVMKGVASLANEAVLVSLDRNTFYYTGISNLFRQPEFHQVEEMTVLSELIDHLDDVMEQFAQRDFTDITTLIGSENPISEVCSTVVTQYRVDPELGGLIAILGPTRMDYQFNNQLLKYVKQLFTRL